MKLTMPTVSSTDACSKTIRRRSSELEQHRSIASGGADLVQLQAEVKGRSLAEKKALLTDLEFKIELPALTGLALKADLCLPWNKMRTIPSTHYITK